MPPEPKDPRVTVTPSATTVGPSGTRFTEVRWFESLDSTNRYLLDEARHGASEGLVVVADSQTAGRGRLGRRWEAPPGDNLLVSVLLRPDLPDNARHLASAVVALAAADACAAATGVSVRIKWPNDLLVGDRKLAGVLAEADIGTGAGQAAGTPAPIVVGIGINVGWPIWTAEAHGLSSELAASATSLLRETGEVVDRYRLLDDLLRSLDPRVAELATSQGRDSQAAEFRDRCATLGSRVRVEMADGSMDGTAVDITSDGHLVVELDDGERRTIVAGDVVHVRTGGEPGTPVR